MVDFIEGRAGNGFYARSAQTRSAGRFSDQVLMVLLRAAELGPLAHGRSRRACAARYRACAAWIAMPGWCGGCGWVLVRIGATAQRVAIPDPGSDALTRRHDTPQRAAGADQGKVILCFWVRGVALAHAPTDAGSTWCRALSPGRTGVRGGGDPADLVLLLGAGQDRRHGAARGNPRSCYALP